MANDNVAARLEQERAERDKRKQELKAALDEDRAEREKQSAKAAEDAVNCKPTPTQAENDAMRVGAMTVEDPKEPDGSPEEGEAVMQRALQPAPHREGYATRRVRRAET